MNETKSKRRPAQLAAHTPGPWQLVPDAQRIGNEYWRNFDLKHGELLIAGLAVSHTHSDSQANARLIAAAPELLAALLDQVDALYTWLDCAGLPADVREGMRISLDKNARAIAKARSE